MKQVRKCCGKFMEIEHYRSAKWYCLRCSICQWENVVVCDNVQAILLTVLQLKNYNYDLFCYLVAKGYITTGEG